MINFQYLWKRNYLLLIIVDHVDTILYTEYTEPISYYISYYNNVNLTNLYVCWVFLMKKDKNVMVKFYLRGFKRFLSLGNTLSWVIVLG